MRRFVTLLVVLVLLLVVVDRAAWWVARRAVAQEIQSAQGLGAPPDVAIGGFPFLTQALRGRYQQIDADLRNPDLDTGLQIDSLKVRLRGVQVSTGDLINRRVESVPVDAATARAAVGFASLDAAVRENLPNQQSRVEFGPGQEPGALAVAGTYRSGGLSARFDVQALLVVEDGDLLVRLPADALDGLPAGLRQPVRALLAKTSRLPDLPFGFRARSVTTSPSGITVEATAGSLELTR